MINKGLTVSAAESCTGGFLSTFFTSKSGASKFFNGSITAYSNRSKNKFLQVSKDNIDIYGVVSEKIVEQMASNVRIKFNADYGLATTGYIDPSSVELCKNNNGLCAWIAISSEGRTISECIMLDESRMKNIHIVSYKLLNLFAKEIV